MNYTRNGIDIARLGLGCMRMTNTTGYPDKAESIATIHAALDAGIQLINTGDFYSSGYNEMLIGEALSGYKRDKAFISVKFGGLSDPKGNYYGLDVRPLTIKNYITYSLKRLKVDYIDLYQPGRIDQAIPVEETIGAISELVKAGYVKHIGLTEVDADTLRRAHSVHPISFVESEYSLFNRSIEKEILPTARDLGIGVVAFGSLAYGLLGGNWSKDRKVEGPNARLPLFYKENLEKNLSLVEALNDIAKEKQITLSQLAVAWVLAKGEDIVPLVGAKKVSQIQDGIKAMGITLSKTEVDRIEAAIPENAIAGGAEPNGLSFKNGIMVR
ncbi:aldo/keto reductase [Clostridium folliculivorans]|uniref:aldo/keto reductase n=1 Tax=Clostridium folliculivorans TaxID=2886038 RepID=UPI0021C4C023|nr:aldo/keto reductase [Clostridium folliculivorans]GKU30179.1 aldo/keto reductase [Clostridium folliculivorans]